MLDVSDYNSQLVQGRWEHGPRSLRWYDRTESRSLDDDSSIHLPTDIDNFRPDMFSFSITICPYHEDVGLSSFTLKVLLERFESLVRVQLLFLITTDVKQLTELIKVRISASNRANGSHECHCR